MTEIDYPAFTQTFTKVCVAFRVKYRPAEAEAITRTYADALAAWPLGDVQAAARAVTGKCKTFPKVADWIAEMPPPRASKPVELRYMTAGEMDEHQRAVACRFNDPPCHCAACRRAGVDARPLRFVPTLVAPDGDELERAFNADRNHVEIVGHWAHGEELARWYAARDAFYALAPAMKPFARVLALIGSGEREPGQEG
jgi:hypothetical protein